MGQSINLFKKYHGKLVEALEFASDLTGKTTDEYKLDGSEGIYLTSLMPQQLSNYTMSGTSRYGTPAEMEDMQQYIAWDYDKSYAITVDNANYRDGGFLKTAGAVIAEQNNEVVAPFIEQNFYEKLFANPGKSITGSAPTSATIMGRIVAIEAAFKNAGIPKNDRYLAIGTTLFQLIRQSLTNCDTVTDKMLLKGVVGKIGTLNVIEVADDMLPANVYMIAWQKKSAVKAFDIKESKAHDNPPGINGALIEYRLRGVSDVVGKRAGGVIVDVNTSYKQANPTISSAGAIGLSSAQKVRYTLDGTDPRYSKSAVEITSGATPTHTANVTHIKAVGYYAGKAPSDVVDVVPTT